MTSLSEKELSALGDLLADEALLVKKFQLLAEAAEDSTIKQQLMGVSQKHQSHFNRLYQQLN